MNGASDTEGELIKWGEEAKNLGEGRTNSDGEDNIPDEEFVNGSFGDFALFPSDFGV